MLVGHGANNPHRDPSLLRLQNTETEFTIRFNITSTKSTNILLKVTQKL